MFARNSSLSDTSQCWPYSIQFNWPLKKKKKKQLWINEWMNGNSGKTFPSMSLSMWSSWNWSWSVYVLCVIEGGGGWEGVEGQLCSLGRHSSSSSSLKTSNHSSRRLTVYWQGQDTVWKRLTITWFLRSFVRSFVGVITRRRRRRRPISCFSCCSFVSTLCVL